MRFLPLLLASCASTQVACAPTTQWYHYVTPCGLHMQGLVPDRTHPNVDERSVPEGWDEDKLAYIEYLSINAKLVTCEQIRGKNLYLHAGAWDLYDDGRWRAGSTYCNILNPRIEAAAPWPDVLAHELHHVGQNCESPPPNDPDTDADHSDWYRSGAYAAIEKIRLDILARYPPPVDGGM